MFEFPQVIEWLLAYKYLVLFPLIVLEGPVVSITAGFLSSINILNIFIVYPVVVLADLIGDIFYYSIGRWGGKRFLRRYGKCFRLKEKVIERLESHFEKHTKKTIIFGKISHAFGAPILVSAGIARVRIYEIFWSNFIVTIPKYLILLSIGFYFGQAYLSFDKYLDYLGIVILVIGLIILLAYYIYTKHKEKYLAFINKLKRKNVLDV